ncbi:DNA polymerase III subunit delta [Candidatus Saccharibacteria bacterium]|nr:DNA polymerase III subunit delta [Candidatus Saccharibacteria bacterium]
MITLLLGDNSFEISRALGDIESGFDGVAEKVDAESVSLAQLPDLLQGGTLFADKRLVIIRYLSENKDVWDIFGDWLYRVHDDVSLVLVETKIDKRTKTYKDIKKLADIREFKNWGDRDIFIAEKWVADEAKKQGLDLEKKHVNQLVARVGLDQWQLYYSLQKLAALDDVDSEVINEVIEENPAENVFNLFDAALRSDVRKIHSMINILQRSQDPYLTFGLLSGQVYQLAALSAGDKSSTDIAGDLGVHPYGLSKLAPHAKKMARSDMRKIVTFFVDADMNMKLTSVDPWLLIETALVQTAQL